MRFYILCFSIPGGTLILRSNWRSKDRDATHTRYNYVLVNLTVAFRNWKVKKLFLTFILQLLIETISSRLDWETGVTLILRSDRELRDRRAIHTRCVYSSILLLSDFLQLVTEEIVFVLFI